MMFMRSFCVENYEKHQMTNMHSGANLCHWQYLMGVGLRIDTDPLNVDLT